MYRLVPNPYNEELSVVKVGQADGEPDSMIPPDPMNADYAEYLRWLADGNEPETEE